MNKNKPFLYHLKCTLNVWYGLFIRETLTRLLGSRMAWLWIILEPIAHILVISSIRISLKKGELVAGAPMVPWITIGIISFFLFRDTVTRGMNAISSNKGLFAYQQVKPIDTVIARALLELFIKIIVFSFIFLFLYLYGEDVVPFKPLETILLFFMIWIFSLGFVFIFSALSTLVKEVEKIVHILLTPLYFLSGVLLPLNFIPQNIQEILMLNPLANGIEAIREFYFQSYWSIPSLSIGYFILFTLFTLLIGLSLQLKFNKRIKMMV